MFDSDKASSHRSQRASRRGMISFRETQRVDICRLEPSQRSEKPYEVQSQSRLREVRLALKCGACWRMPGWNESPRRRTRQGPLITEVSFAKFQLQHKLLILRYLRAAQQVRAKAR